MSITEERLAALEAAFEEVKKQKGIMGVRGPAGPIDAAVVNAREALAQDLAATMGKFSELQRVVAEFDGKLDSRIRQKIDAATTALQRKIEDFSKNYELELTAVVLKVLQDYWVLDSECRVLDHLQRPFPKS